MTNYDDIVYSFIKEHYYKILREPGGQLKHKFIVPGAVYAKTLWDWDSWLTDVAITQVAVNEGSLKDFFRIKKAVLRILPILRIRKQAGLIL